MKPPKLALPLLVALGCLVAGATTTSAVAAPTRNHKHAARNPKKLRLESVKVAGKAGPLTLRVRADVRTEVRLKVDGHRVDHSFEQVGRHSQRINLRAGDHLRAGTNRLSLTATRLGVSSRADRSVKVPGWALHADAGEDTGTVVHGRVQIGATPGPAAAAGDVHYDWRIVGRPNDAAATLTSKDDPDPVLHATDPGRYLLQETADPEGPTNRPPTTR